MGKTTVSLNKGRYGNFNKNRTCNIANNFNQVNFFLLEVLLQTQNMIQTIFFNEFFRKFVDYFINC